MSVEVGLIVTDAPPLITLAATQCLDYIFVLDPAGHNIEAVCHTPV